MERVTVYTRKEAADYCERHADPDSFVSHSLTAELSDFAANFRANTIALSLKNRTLMGTVTDKEFDSAPMCSPYNLFCVYPQTRLDSMENKRLLSFLKGVTSLMGKLFRSMHFNRVVQINNKPCDAIIHDNLSLLELRESIDQLTRRFPGHAILFPRIDRVCHPELFSYLEKAGCKWVPTRPVHLFCPDGDYLKKSHTKRDFAFLRKTPYTYVSHEEFSEEDLPKLHRLYRMLFIDKHSNGNPDLTEHFFRKAHANRWYEFFGFRSPEGELEAFFSYEANSGVMACGPLGYDTEKPKELGLYRLLFAKSLQIASENGWILNFGGGNERFKLNRGSLREVGYTAVYDKHLSYAQRIPWTLLSTAGKKMTLKIFEKNLF